jgi:hypothetical protein
MADVTFDELLKIRDEATEVFVSRPQATEAAFGRKDQKKWERTQRLIDNAVYGVKLAQDKQLPMETLPQFKSAVIAMVVPWLLRWMAGIVMQKIIEFIFERWMERKRNASVR